MSLFQVRFFRFKGLPLAFLVLLSACAAPRSTSPTAQMPLSRLSPFAQRTAQREIEMASRMMEAGEYHAVIPRLQYAIAKYPGTDSALEGRYLLGLSYYHISGHREAIDALREYIRLAPDGKHAGESREILARLIEDYKARFPNTELLDEEIDTMRRQLEQQPGSGVLLAQLAQKIWSRGDYEEAGALYFRVAQEHPELAKALPIAERIEVFAPGEYVVLSPAELQRRAIEKDPVMIYGVNAFKGGRDFFSAVPRYYNVTGQAINRSDTELHGVEIQVTIYGFGGTVYDTTTIAIGRMGARQERAFNARFTNFPDINQIERYECIAYFQR